MPKPSFRPLLLTLACCLVLGLLAGCGGGSSSESLVHFQGSSASISKATLDHWMRATVGADFRSSVGTKAPQGLAAEPANDGECVEAAKKVVRRSFTGQLKLTDPQIKRKCEELHEALKDQTLAALISAQWTSIEAADAGVHVTPEALHTEFERYRDQDMPSEAQLQRYLGERHWLVSDILFELKQRLLVNGLKPKFNAEVKEAGNDEAAFGKVTLEHYNSNTAKTSCKRGYVVPGCKGYREPAGGAPVPNIILEGFTQGRVSSKSPYPK